MALPEIDLSEARPPARAVLGAYQGPITTTLFNPISEDRFSKLHAFLRGGIEIVERGKFWGWGCHFLQAASGPRAGWRAIALVTSLVSQSRGPVSDSGRVETSQRGVFSFAGRRSPYLRFW